MIKCERFARRNPNERKRCARVQIAGSPQFAMYLSRTAIFFVESGFYVLRMIMGTFFTLVKVRLSRVISRYWVYFEVLWETRFCGKWCSNYFDLVFANGQIEWRYFLINCRREHPLSNATGLSSNGWVLMEKKWKNELACIIVRTCTTKFRPPLLDSITPHGYLNMSFVIVKKY